MKRDRELHEIGQAGHWQRDCYPRNSIVEKEMEDYDWRKELRDGEGDEDEDEDEEGDDWDGDGGGSASGRKAKKKEGESWLDMIRRWR